jgi:alkylation response protein AidB-like acyl-CoA dehydrogenase
VSGGAPGSADLGLSDEQRDFVAAIRDFCARECTPEKRTSLLAGQRDDHSPELARRMAELGWYGLTIPEEVGIRFAQAAVRSRLVISS